MYETKSYSSCMINVCGWQSFNEDLLFWVFSLSWSSKFSVVYMFGKLVSHCVSWEGNIGSVYFGQMGNSIIKPTCIMIP